MSSIFLPVILKNPYSTNLETGGLLRLVLITVWSRKEKRLFDSTLTNITKEMTAENLIVGFPNGSCCFTKKTKTYMGGKALSLPLCRASVLRFTSDGWAVS